jgi:hypothetical protein
MKPLTLAITLARLFCICVHADLLVNAASPQITGNKATVKLTMANTFDESVSSARAAMFLLDQNGKMLANKTQWVIGGPKNSGPLAAHSTNIFYFVVTSAKPLTSTNLTAQISFSRAVLNDGTVIKPSAIRVRTATTD